MCIILRHGNDECKTNYKHDPHLKHCNHCKNDIIITTEELIKKYGYPNKIYCSPFTRVRETVDLMHKVFKKRHVHVDIIIEPKLSRYFTSAEKKNPGVRHNTLKYNPPIYESSDAFKNRVNQIEYKLKHQNVWVITHYLVMRQIALNNHIHLPNRMPFLYSMVI